jgi:membrane protease YdiL (CAAX protease family)
MLQPDKRVILSLALVTLMGFPLIGMAIVKMFSSHPIQIMVREVAPITQQLGIGLLVGTAMGFFAHWITETKLLRPATQKYSRLLGSLQLNTIDKILISVCAGFGEELLFRGAIQPFWGIIITAVFFVAIHGYIDLKDWRISIYGLIMTVFIGVLGYLTEALGIWTAVIAHTMIDIVLLMRMKDAGPSIPIADLGNDI